MPGCHDDSSGERILYELQTINLSELTDGEKRN